MLIRDLKVDEEFKTCLPELSQSEYDELEKDIIKNGVLSPIIVWDGVIVDGHNRYEISQNLGYEIIPTKEKDFGSREEALEWILRNQLGRRNLNENDRRYLLGKLYEARKMMKGGDGSNQYRKKEQTDQNDHIANDSKLTSEIIANEQGVSAPTVRRAEKFAQGVDIGESISPGFKADVLSGKVNVGKEVIQSIPKLEKGEQEDVVKKIRTGALQKEDQEVKTKKCKLCGREFPITKFTHGGNGNICNHCRSSQATSKDAFGNIISIDPEIRKMTADEIIGDLYNVDKVIEYTDDDMKQELDALTENYKNGVQNILEMHKELLTNEKSKDKVLHTLTLLQSEIAKWKETYCHARV